MTWFGKKVELEVVGSNGKPKMVKISERQFNQWAAKGKVHPRECQVHILDPTRPERLETWAIGKDVSPKVWGRCKDENGDLYVLVHYTDSQPSQHVTAKDIWDKTKRDVFSSPKPSSFEEYFEYQHKMLLSSSFEVQAIAAAGINTLSRAFNLEYPDLESFRNADEGTKAEYLRKMSDMIKKMASDELANKAPEGTSRGAVLLLLYLTAVAKGDAAMVTRIADALEPFNKMAYDMLRDSEQ
jgi:hypothetical protein